MKFNLIFLSNTFFTEFILLYDSNYVAKLNNLGTAQQLVEFIFRHNQSKIMLTNPQLRVVLSDLV